MSLGYFPLQDISTQIFRVEMHRHAIDKSLRFLLQFSIFPPAAGKQLVIF